MFLLSKKGICEEEVQSEPILTQVPSFLDARWQKSLDSLWKNVQAAQKVINLLGERDERETGKFMENPGKIDGDPLGETRAGTIKRTGISGREKLGVTEAEVKLEMAGSQSRERRETLREVGSSLEEVEVKSEKERIGKGGRVELKGLSEEGAGGGCDQQ